jgi:hypothetical protein
VAVTAEHRAAQRRLAREIHSGTYKPSGIGAKARRIAALTEQELIDRAQELKKKHFGTRIKWNSARSRMNLQVDPDNGLPRGRKDLRLILDDIEQWDKAGAPDDWEGLTAIHDGEFQTAFYYH